MELAIEEEEAVKDEHGELELEKVWTMEEFTAFINQVPSKKQDSAPAGQQAPSGQGQQGPPAAGKPAADDGEF